MAPNHVVLHAPNAHVPDTSAMILYCGGAYESIQTCWAHALGTYMRKQWPQITAESAHKRRILQGSPCVHRFSKSTAAAHGSHIHHTSGLTWKHHWHQLQTPASSRSFSGIAWPSVISNARASCCFKRGFAPPAKASM
jgi:hypothetical protein